MSWGTRITILYLGFVGLILTLVIMSFRQKVDLVSQDYYGQELKFQERIDAIDNSTSHEKSFTVSQSENFILLEFPQYFAKKNLKGDILFFRPSDSSKDKKIKLKPDQNCRQQVNTVILLKGLYKVKVDFESEGRKYYFEKDLIIQ